MKRSTRVNLLIILFFCALAGMLLCIVVSRVYIFDGLVGPTEASVIPKKKRSGIDRYTPGSTSRLAILLTDEDSAWLGLAHGLKAVWVPFLITKDCKWALEHKVVMVYPYISGRVLSVPALKAIASFPRKGGTLIGVNVLGGGLNEVFGFENAVPSRDRKIIKYNNYHPLLSAFAGRHKLEFSVQDKINAKKKTSGKYLKLGTYGYAAAINEPIAVFDDGTAAVTQKPYAAGKNYAFGIDIGHFLLKGYNNQAEGISTQYVNGFEASLDVLLVLIKNI